jgi:hypothetical protein
MDIRSTSIVIARHAPPKRRVITNQRSTSRSLQMCVEGGNQRQHACPQGRAFCASKDLL